MSETSPSVPPILARLEAHRKATGDELEYRIGAYEYMDARLIDGHIFTEDGVIVEVIYTTHGVPLEHEAIAERVSKGQSYGGILSEEEVQTMQADMESFRADRENRV